MKYIKSYENQEDSDFIIRLKTKDNLLKLIAQEADSLCAVEPEYIKGGYKLIFYFGDIKNKKDNTAIKYIKNLIESYCAKFSDFRNVVNNNNYEKKIVIIIMNDKIRELNSFLETIFDSKKYNM